MMSVGDKSQSALTVLCVDTSSCDFIEDHVLGTTGEAALHTVTHRSSFSPEQDTNDVRCTIMSVLSQSSYGGRNWQRVASGSLHVWTQGLAQA